MKTTCAILVGLGAPLAIEEVEIPRLVPGQVLVEVAYAGVCHTQLLECRGHRGADPYLPHCLGHEGSGVVVDTGADVTKVRAGDRVILSWMKGSGADVRGTTYRWGDRTVNAGAITTFGQHMILSENRLTRLDAGFPLRDAAFLGCAIATGAGAVINTAHAQAGSDLVVFGVGGIGLCAVGGARLVGCSRVVAVDARAAALQRASGMGATHAIEAGRQDVAQELRALRSDGFDVAIEATGRPVVMAQALAAVRAKGGAAVIIGNARHGEILTLDPRELNQGKRLLGTWGGDNDPDRDFPNYARWIQERRFPLEPLGTVSYALARVNEAIDDLESGRVARPILELSAAR